MIQCQVIPGTPGDVVIGARGVTAHANSAYDLISRVIQGESAPEHIDPADALADHRDEPLCLLRVATCLAGLLTLSTANHPARWRRT